MSKKITRAQVRKHAPARIAKAASPARRPRKTSQRVQSVARALKILNVLLDYAEGATPKELARRTGLNVSTAYHLLNTLAEEGYLSWRPNGVVQLGPAIPKLYTGFLHRAQPTERLVEIVLSLARSTLETCYLVAWQYGDVVIQFMVETPLPLKVAGPNVGTWDHAHARASGKAMLAYLSPPELDAYLKTHPLILLTPNTIGDSETLKAELVRVRSQGYAMDLEELALGVCCLAAPVLSSDGTAEAAVAVAAPTARFQQNVDALKQLVMEKAREAGLALGLGTSDGTAAARHDQLGEGG